MTDSITDKPKIPLTSVERRQLLGMLACYFCDVEVVLRPGNVCLDRYFRLSCNDKIVTVNHLGNYLQLDSSVSADDVDRWLVDRYSLALKNYKRILCRFEEDEKENDDDN